MNKQEYAYRLSHRVAEMQKWLAASRRELSFFGEENFVRLAFEPLYTSLMLRKQQLEAAVLKAVGVHGALVSTGFPTSSKIQIGKRAMHLRRCLEVLVAGDKDNTPLAKLLSEDDISFLKLFFKNICRTPRMSGAP